jgi:hypothetical protein
MILLAIYKIVSSRNPMERNDERNDAIIIEPEKPKDQSSTTCCK